jgi:hypothetical protein
MKEKKTYSREVLGEANFTWTLQIKACMFKVICQGLALKNALRCLLDVFWMACKQGD